MYNAPEKSTKNDTIVHTINTVDQDEVANDVMSIKKIISIFTLIVIFGVISGYVGANLTKKSSDSNTVSKDKNTDEKKPKTAPAKKAGIDDTKTFKDSAEGILKPGGIEGEGDFHLERPGGESQNVYLTSTAVDLSKYLDQKVKVQGETYSAEKAGWLMDVGLIELSQ